MAYQVFQEIGGGAVEVLFAEDVLRSVCEVYFALEYAGELRGGHLREWAADTVETVG